MVFRGIPGLGVGFRNKVKPEFVVRCSDGDQMWFEKDQKVLHFTEVKNYERRELIVLQFSSC